MGIDERFAGARQVAEPGDPVLLIARPPLLSRIRRTSQQTPDLRGRVALGGMQHDLSALDHPHFRGAGANDPFKLGSILRTNLDALRQRRHTEPPPSLTPASNEFGKHHHTLQQSTNFTDEPLGAVGACQTGL